jgi:hypothetical protein
VSDPAVPARTVHLTEANAWLDAAGVIAGASFVTSLPDVSEVPAMSIAQWKQWFVASAKRVLAACPDDGVAIFYQTDIIDDGLWIDKGHLVSTAADEAGTQLLWHRIVCRKPPGTLLFGRPAYTHMLCFSKGIRPPPGRARADVLPGTGEMTWTRAMGVAACVEACRFIRDETRSRTIVDPFCGHGTALAVANALGFDAVGVELSAKRAKKARNLKVAVDPR